jgi:SAM-dependent methyltransferase
MGSKYIHKITDKAELSPYQIIPLIKTMINPKSIVDVGCGVGHWLAAFKSYEIEDLLGIDGFHLKKELFVLDQKCLLQFDLEKKFEVDRTFDLAISLEVAEHISEKNASKFIESLTRLSDTILFSAAIPGQGGQNHVNEQWPSYWQKKFKDFGYSFFDNIRPKIWWNTGIKAYYRQNMFIVSSKSITIEPDLPVLDTVHPELLLNKVDKYLTGAFGLNKMLKIWKKKLE